MSPTERELRDRVANELADHLDEHGLSNPWIDGDRRTTRVIYSTPMGPGSDAYGPNRADFQQSLADRAFDAERGATGATLALVFTAGPPGAGKSWVIRQDARWSTFRQLDADDFKDALLEQAQRDGLLERLLSAQFSDGRPVHLRELSAFVHAESLAVFEKLRNRCVDRNESIVLHGTLNDHDAVTGVLTYIAERNKPYDRIEIAHVVASRAAAIEGVMQRWWDGRVSFAEGKGGRFVSPRSLDRYFDKNQVPNSERVVQEVSDHATALGFDVVIRRFER